MKTIIFFVVLLIACGTAQSQLYIHENAHFKSAGNTFIVLHDLGIVNKGYLDQTAGTFKFTSDHPVRFSSSVPVTFYHWEIAKTSAADTVTLEQDVRLPGGISFVKGLLELNKKNIFLEATGQLINEHEDSRVTGAEGGYISSEVIMQTGADKINPGLLGAQISTKKVPGSLTVLRFHKEIISASGIRPVLRQYQIIPQNNSGLDATLRFHYFDAERRGLEEKALTLYQSDVADWEEIGDDAADISDNYFEKTGLEGLYTYTLALKGALPVTGLTLSGRWHEDHSVLSWNTITEYNNSHFNVQRKHHTDGDFITIGSKPTLHPAGNSSASATYYWQDKNVVVQNEPVLYRIQQVDRNGRFSYSNITAVKVQPGGKFIKNVYPTIGVAGFIHLKTGNMPIATMEASIIGIDGRIHFRKKLHYQDQELKFPQLPAGMFQLRLQSGSVKYQCIIITK